MNRNELAEALRSLAQGASPALVGLNEQSLVAFGDDHLYERFVVGLGSFHDVTVRWFLDLIPPLVDHLEQHGSVSGFVVRDFVDGSVEEMDEPLAHWLASNSGYLDQALQRRRHQGSYQLFMEAQRLAIEDYFGQVVACVGHQLA